MAVSVEWEIKGTEFANCNCIYACPCQFNALPDKGFCEAVAGYQIHQGHFGDVPLDGLRAVGIWHWPGAVHEGNGSMQLIIDERADANQRDALVKILSGQQLVVGFSRRENLATSGGGPGFSVGSIQPGKVQLSGGAEWLEARVGKRFPRNWGRRSLSNLSCRTFLSVAVVRRRS
jgi:hypothetical protein